ncbi:MAG: Asp-tRNA(Asn)/Glu-tRNA(Gln) amidotransferase subunit GatC [Eubacteriales bacterium]|nr:Asp-tRNA(Asn)/Glu-tRNA(Gln) amidotransferase subunit GatC [Eubacteriales bacterium]
MTVTKKEVAYIAGLANLRFDDASIEKIADEFSKILNHFDNISKEDLSGIEMYSFADEPLRLRPDKAVPFEEAGALYDNTKSMQDTAIKIPKVVD